MKTAAVAAIVGVLALGAGYAIGRRHGDEVSLPSARAPLEGRPRVDVELPGPNERMEHVSSSAASARGAGLTVGESDLQGTWKWGLHRLELRLDRTFESTLIRGPNDRVGSTGTWTRDGNSLVLRHMATWAVTPLKDPVVTTHSTEVMNR